MKQLFLRLLASALFYTGAIVPLRAIAERYQFRRDVDAITRRFARRRQRFVQILTYHSVNDDRDPYLPGTPTRAFARQMRYLAKHYTVCEAGQLKRMLEDDEIPARAIIITFDDGYRDVLLHAHPVLTSLHLPAIVFLPAAHIGTHRLLWHDQVAHAFRLTQCDLIPAFWREGEALPLSTVAERVAAFRATVRYLRGLDASARNRSIDRLQADLAVRLPENAPNDLMSWDEVRRMDANGISFGSHTATHPILARLTPEEARRELVDSKAIIEAELGQAVRLLAYPNGTRDDFTDEIKAIARDAGYECALSTIFGANQAGADLFELRRGGPWDEHLPSFALRLIWQRLCF